MNALDWLLDADPAIRWQAMRDLTDAPGDQVAAERARVATEGWGARLLALKASCSPSFVRSWHDPELRDRHRSRAPRSLTVTIQNAP